MKTCSKCKDTKELKAFVKSSSSELKETKRYTTIDSDKLLKITGVEHAYR